MSVAAERSRSIPLRGTLLNTATVAVGAGCGLAAGRYVSPAYETTAVTGLGLVVSLIGVRMFLQTKNPLVVVGAVVLGGLIGVALGIAPSFAAFAEWARQRLGGGGSFNDALITTSVLFCVGPMTLLGCLQDGLERKIELLALKSTLDGFAAFFFAATLGAGVLVSAVVVLVVQGALTLGAGLLQRFLADSDSVSELTATGGALMLGIGLTLLSLKKLQVATYLPALAVAPIIAAAARRLEKTQ